MVLDFLLGFLFLDIYVYSKTCVHLGIFVFIQLKMRIKLAHRSMGVKISTFVRYNNKITKCVCAPGSVTKPKNGYFKIKVKDKVIEIGIN